MTDVAWVQIAVGLVTPIVVAYFGNRTTLTVAHLNHQQDLRSREAAVQVAEVKRALEDSTEASALKLSAQDAKLNELGYVVKATHSFVNARMGAVLHESYDALRRLAEWTKTPEDLAAAARARKACEEHEAAQATVDAQPGTDAEKKGT